MASYQELEALTADLSAFPDCKFFNVTAIIRPWRLKDAVTALTAAGIRGLTVSDTSGIGFQGGMERYGGAEFGQSDLIEKKKVDKTTACRQQHLAPALLVGEPSSIVPAADGACVTLLPFRTAETGGTAELMAGGMHSNPLGASDRRRPFSAPAVSKARVAYASRTVKAAAAEASGVVTVTIQCQYHCEFGQVMKAVGANPEVGAWNVDSAPVLQWSPGDLWSLDIRLPATTSLAFKLVVVNGDGSATWEAGENRVVDEISDASIIECSFGKTSETVLDASQSEGDVGEPPKSASKSASASSAVEPSPTGSNSVGQQSQNGPRPMDTTAARSASMESSNGKVSESATTAVGGAAGVDETPPAPTIRDAAAVREQSAAEDAISLKAPPPVKESGLSDTSMGAGVSVRESLAKSDTSEAPQSIAQQRDAAAASEQKGEPVAEEPLASSTSGEPKAADEEPPAPKDAPQAEPSARVEAADTAPLVNGKSGADAPRLAAVLKDRQVQKEEFPQAMPSPSAASSSDVEEEEEEEEEKDASNFLLSIAAGLCLIGALPAILFTQLSLATTGCGLPPPGTALNIVATGAYGASVAFALACLSIRGATGKAPPAGPGGSVRLAEGGSWLLLTSAAAVAAYQVGSKGMDPAKLLGDRICYPDQNISKPLAEQFQALPSKVRAPDLSSVSSAVKTSSASFQTSLTSVTDQSTNFMAESQRDFSARAADMSTLLQQKLAELSSAVGKGTSQASDAWDDLAESTSKLSSDVLKSTSGMSKNLGNMVQDISADKKIVDAVSSTKPPIMGGPTSQPPSTSDAARAQNNLATTAPESTTSTSPNADPRKLANAGSSPVAQTSDPSAPYGKPAEKAPLASTQKPQPEGLPASSSLTSAVDVEGVIKTERQGGEPAGSTDVPRAKASESDMVLPESK